MQKYERIIENLVERKVMEDYFSTRLKHFMKEQQFRLCCNYAQRDSLMKQNQ